MNKYTVVYYDLIGKPIKEDVEARDVDGVDYVVRRRLSELGYISCIIINAEGNLFTLEDIVKNGG